MSSENTIGGGGGGKQSALTGAILDSGSAYIWANMICLQIQIMAGVILNNTVISFSPAQ